MLTRPTTDAVLRSIAAELAEKIEPELQTETARVAMGMIQQMLRGCAVRAAHEMAWMHEECDAIESAVAAVDDAATAEALTAYRNAPAGLELEAVVARYDQAGEALAVALEHAYRVGDGELVERLRPLLHARSGREMEIVGALALVGRG